ncbi:MULTISPECIES: serine/threonine-protein kinase [Cryobacterium]|uniref:non-specific serine/threonine protein kinase n=1 Tax=Cryobacterium breve TaxID=1259258 RepID=A0ABY2J5X2_9MICO|nr:MULTISPECIES: serine/threonine-protein kinase [Cryobacterium]TFC95228.1 serine/threonine protein kinase [Cryobacterium sp. TmT3-12]TFD00316.1 serine/threonine protein kinase [Cryobacterium breve]
MSSAVSSPPELPGYEFVSTLGSGGFSDVFLYDQQLPRRRVAVKVLLTEQLNDLTKARFVDEANLMAQLSTHPSIVTIYHAGVAGDGRPFLVMEYCAGPSLSERYKREPLTVEDTLRIGVRLAGAVATAHTAGILHRDIKPANVLTNDFGGPALTDFGISTTLDQTSLHRGAAAGTGHGADETQDVGLSVPWSPPEMFEDAPTPDVRSDVFSLAATLHTLLAGRTPFEIGGRSNGTLDLIGRIERGVITPIGRSDMPASLLAVLAKGMSTDRASRYSSAVDFARALQRIELELGYSATAIEVPRLTLAEPSASTGAGENETRARSVVTIAAQPTRPARPMVPSAATRAGTAPGTPVRGAFVVNHRPEPTSSASPAEATVLRGPPVAVPAAVALEAESAPEDAAPQPGRRGLIVGISAAAGVVLVAAVLAAAFVTGSTAPGLTPTTRPSSPAGNADVVAGVPLLTLEGTATSVDGTVVTFSVTNPDPQDNDVYRWARAEAPNQPQLSSSADIAVDQVTPGERVCIDLYLQRSDGKLSEANRVCDR